MKLIERKITENNFVWNQATGPDKYNLQKFLNSELGIGWTDIKDLDITVLPNKIEISNKNDYKTLTLELDEDLQGGVIQKAKRIAREILKHNEVVDQYFNKSCIVTVKINGKERKRLFAYQNVRDDEMRVFLRPLEEDCSITVWFNAWKYEQEEHFAIDAFMKTIAYSLIDHPVFTILRPLITDSLFRGLGKLSEGVMDRMIDMISSEETRKDLYKKLSPKLDLLTYVEKDSLYYDGANKIEQAFQKIKREYNNCKIIVFIDDLDRCSVGTVLQVFESIKVLLALEGFVYVIGLSNRAISKLLGAEYNKIGIKEEEAREMSSEYLNKIIQVPFEIPYNTDDKIMSLIDELANRIGDEKRDVIKETMDFIALSVKRNPREIKRLINHILINYDLQSRFFSSLYFIILGHMYILISHQMNHLEGYFSI
jgi:hypothetical protein